MTLGGLSIAIGEVVDDAVIDVENIYRRLRENRALAASRARRRRVALAGLGRGAQRRGLCHASPCCWSLCRCSACPAWPGRLFYPLGLAYIWAILASLVVALTVTPALCILLLGEADLAPQEPPAVRWLKRGYRKCC